jgi:hypothetical protein
MMLANSTAGVYYTQGRTDEAQTRAATAAERATK